MHATETNPQHAASDSLRSLRELAAIFASGILRLKSSRCQVPELSPNLSESTAQGLEFPAETRLSVVPRVNGRETARESAL